MSLIVAYWDDWLWAFASAPNPDDWSAHFLAHRVDRDGRHADRAFDRPTLERVAGRSVT